MKSWSQHWNGKRLNSPNDVVVKSDGTIWFTDPPYGIISDHEGIRAESEIGNNQVYRFDPASGELSVVADDFDRPNGLAFSPDESDSTSPTLGYARGAGFGFEEGRPRHVRGFTVVDGKKLKDSRVIAVINDKVPDGLRVDTGGCCGFPPATASTATRGRRAAGPNPRAGNGGEPHFRRFRQVTLVHLRDILGLCHRNRPHRRPMAMTRNRAPEKGP